MRTLNILLGSADRRMNNALEAAILDVCYETAVVEFTRVAPWEQFVRQASCGGFHMMIMVPNLMLSNPRRARIPLSILDVAEGVRTIRSHCLTPLFAVGIPQSETAAVIESGVDQVFGLHFQGEAFPSEVRRALSIPEQQDQEPVPGLFETLRLFFRRLGRARRPV